MSIHQIGRPAATEVGHPRIRRRSAGLRSERDTRYGRGSHVRSRPSPASLSDRSPSSSISVASEQAALIKGTRCQTPRARTTPLRPAYCEQIGRASARKTRSSGRPTLASMITRRPARSQPRSYAGDDEGMAVVSLFDRVLSARSMNGSASPSKVTASRLKPIAIVACAALIGFVAYAIVAATQRSTGAFPPVAAPSNCTRVARAVLLDTSLSGTPR